MMRFKQKAVAVVGLAMGSLLAAQSAVADSLNYNVLELQSQVQREVSNDTLSASVFVELTQNDPQRLAAEVSKRMEEATRLAKGYPSVRVKTLGQQTYPVYNNQNKLQGWRTRADLSLESEDFAAATQLIGKLQGVVQLGGIQFAVSPKVREKVEAELMVDAVKQFRQRADILAGAVAPGKPVRIVHLAVNSGGGEPPRMYAMEAKAAAPAGDAAPVVTPGTSQVSVSINGTVQVE
ncbi:SIMPL domain-containing protein [Leeia aquatica]|uniref:SIMPL domain-containing protein n=1 Tax=Leeia aquatica TaxID=2725557 RepID=A0A847S4G8_9NEIS|nr:SIMPL domain-containing protein [Leeia aquatica]NLR73655.1 SIMPL domain-containing protein [Leeia aquatica]